MRAKPTMGAWGTGIFSDDDACDIREQYRAMLGDGLDGPAATDRLLEEWSISPPRSEPTEDTVFWLALAATQWRLGRLEDRVKAAAVAIIDNGSDLRRWREETPRHVPRREAALARLRHRLDQPQPAAKRVRKQFRHACDWSPGEVVAYRLGSGRLALFCVVDLSQDQGGVHPECEVLDWVGTNPPDASTIRALPPRRSIEPGEQGSPRLILGAVSARELPGDRIVRTGIRIGSRRPASASSTFALWRTLDDQLRKTFGLE